MEFFKKYFNINSETRTTVRGEYTVACPFLHTDPAGNKYKETNPSAHINSDNSVFHCKSCGTGISEAAFLSKIEGISYRDALITLGMLNKSDVSEWEIKQNNLKSSQYAMGIVNELGLGNVVDILRLGFSGDGIDFPVFMYDELLDVRNYNPTRKPKVLGRKGSTNLIIPFDLWREDKRDTLLVAGEKDMAIARVHGFNAITFTGGEQSFPKLFKNSFKGRNIYIVYDNDSAGIEGAQKSAHFIKEAGGYPYIVTGHYATCVEKGEDLHDFFMKYGKSSDNLQEILESTELAEDNLLELVKDRINPLIKISESAKGEYVNKRYVRSKVTVLSIFEDMFSVPDYVVMEKEFADEKSMLAPGEKLEWFLDDSNIQDLLYMMDGKNTEASQRAAIKSMVGISEKELGIKFTAISSVPVFKSVITDILDNSSEDSVLSELLMFSVGIENKLFAGNKYTIQYKPVTHPLDGQKIVGIINKLEEASSSIDNFQVTDAVKRHLDVFKQGKMDLVEKMEEIFERSKGFVGVESRKLVTWATDMFFHTPLEFKMGRRTERAYLDIMIVGDPRTMKSETAKRMREMYELGTIVSLKSATEAGLIGGSDKVSGGGFKTKIGMLPQSHKGAIIMEEFSGGGMKLISQLTEIRSSGRARLLRVNGSTDVPARVRMLSISNPAKNGGMTPAVAQFPSGVKLVLDLVGASEDIARYDFFLVVDAVDKYTSPLDMFDLEPYDKQAYMDRVRWIWSRTAEQVEIDRPTAEYLMKVTDMLNADYDCHVKFFGAEAWKKLVRIAIAVAGMTVSTDESYQKIIVNREHIDFAARFMVSLYDNDIFKLRNYVQNERAYNRCNEVDIAALQKLFNRHESTLREMEISVNLTQKQLQLVSGLDMKEFGGLVHDLGTSKFIQWQGERIVPTGKFRQAMKKMKSIHLKTAVERG